MSGIERSLAGGPTQVLKLSVASGVGSELASRYVVRGVPTLIVLDGQGEQVLRQVGRIEATSVLEAVAQLVDGQAIQVR